MKIKVSVDEIHSIFNQLLNNERSRESVSNWAFVREQAEGEGRLIYVPACEEKKIWKAILYLIGIDIKDKQNSYLHDFNDIKTFRFNNQI